MKNIVLLSFSGVKRSGQLRKQMVNLLWLLKKKAPAEAGALLDRSVGAIDVGTRDQYLAMIGPPNL